MAQVAKGADEKGSKQNSEEDKGLRADAFL